VLESTRIGMKSASSDWFRYDSID